MCLLTWVVEKFNSQWPFLCIAFTEAEVHKEEIIEQLENSAAINQQNWMVFTRVSGIEIGIYALYP